MSASAARVPCVNVLSNRLPIRLEASGHEYQVKPGDGGLVSAMDPVLKRNGGRWIGWPGIAQSQASSPQALKAALDSYSYGLTPVDLSNDEVKGFYEGYSNGVLWPLFHGFKRRCQFDSGHWRVYRQVNEKFARATRASIPSGDTVWIHDYQLMTVAPELRRLGHTGRLGFFLHIPFPELEDLICLPERGELLMALLSHDLLGFQTTRDRDHFIECMERLVPQTTVRRRATGNLDCIEFNGRRIWVGTFPIGIDPDDFEKRANSDRGTARAAEMRAALGRRKLILGVDRLDYSKGLIERLKAFERFLDRRSCARNEVLFCQVTVPSRDTVPEYREYRRELEKLVGRLQGQFAGPNAEPIRYIYNTVDKDELAALYRTADVALVTPLRDGMNLVAKEYCASQVDEQGVLVLSEMAGAAAQLQDEAVLTNPYSIEATADALERALDLAPSERRRRMVRARKIVRDEDVFHWANTFLRALKDPQLFHGRAPRPSYRPTFSPSSLGKRAGYRLNQQGAQRTPSAELPQ